ncbi:MAG: Ada metal-binding domain-containing protein [Pseudomonadota bacterium]
MVKTATSSDDVFERARLSRDPRFDGRFFIAVITTGIYCRPVCPATPPKRENIRFYPTAAAAGEAGFRPCLRCRPETAPGTPAWQGTSTTVRRALRMIESGALNDGDVESLADRLGVTSRHLRRLFQQILGASPLAVAHTQRLHLAKRLIDQTRLPFSDIAVLSGFGSVRRFNDTFSRTYQRAPRELRKRRAPARDDGLELRLPFPRGYDADSLLGFLGSRAIPGVEVVEQGVYRRALRLDGDIGLVEVGRLGDALSVRLIGLDTHRLVAVVQRVRSVFDLDAPMTDINDWLDRDPAIRLEGTPDVRVPGCWDGFELAVRAVLGQQISVAAATTIAARIAERYGEAIDMPGSDSINRLFPTPRKLARAQFNNLGLVTSRINTIKAIARGVECGELDLAEDSDPQALRESLTAIRGVGPWTAEYIAMRALKDPDAFPSSDLGLLKGMDHHAGHRLKPKELEHHAEAWKPWRAYAALRLWRRSASGG